MSLKCLALCAFALLLSIGATWAETRILQPRPVGQLRQSKDLGFQNEEQINEFADIDIDDDEAADAADNAYLDELDAQNIAELTKLINGVELDLNQPESRASPGGRGGRRNKRRNRSGSSKRNSKNRNSNRRIARRGNKRAGNKRYRSGKRRKTDSKPAQQSRI